MSKAGGAFDFEGQLTALVAAQLALANRDPAKLAKVITSLAAQMASALAVAFRDDTRELDRIVGGLEGIIHRGAVDRIAVIRALEANEE